MLTCRDFLKSHIKKIAEEGIKRVKRYYKNRWTAILTD